MKSKAATIVRAFDGSLADAEGLLAVERATFDEAPYPAEQVRAMLAEGPQRAWLALAGDDVVGFVIAFPATSLRGTWWEIDLLAVDPDWTGRGLATRLVRAAAAHGARVANRARAVIATDNAASDRVFRRVGFWPESPLYDLFVYRPGEQKLGPRPSPDVPVRKASDPAEAAPWLPAEQTPPPDAPGLTLLLAERAGRPAGYAALIDVQTLLYRGAWIESLEAPGAAPRAALIHAAAARGAAAGQDEIGIMVPEGDAPRQRALRDAGFRSLGAFRRYRADLPLPGRAGTVDARV